MEDPTFVWRASIGTLVLLGLAGRDRVRSGTWSRLREIAFLFAVTGTVMVLAVVHDAVTWNVAPEYFSIGKSIPGASTSFGPVAWVALEAGWTAGLVLGLVLVVSNNPSNQCEQLAYRALTTRGGEVLVLALLSASALASLSLLVVDHVTQALVDAGVAHPTEYVLVQAAHLGTYVGLAVGALRAAIVIRGSRRALAVAFGESAPMNDGVPAFEA